MTDVFLLPMSLQTKGGTFIHSMRSRNSMTNASYLTPVTLEYVIIIIHWSFRLNAGSYRLARPTMRYTLP
ncbi:MULTISPECIES: hypothetical protein [Bacillus cereus group]|uniref:hypothetical protein n=1 Tax=Bacillus cereus group TaxID=86661 RepID=UPI0022E03F55|nr:MULTISPECIES: hypothetical protein [Bacillus cereus group]MDA2665530.1 hypothetical protein [Bacillus cereus group sp. Bc032]MDA2681838.1 hypothetical protein [Bacillus cereus group sp. Bc029]